MSETSHAISIKRALAEAAAVLEDAGVADARRDAASLLGFVTNHDRSYLLIHPDDTLPGDALTRFLALLARRARHEPMQYITGRQAFFNLEFEVTPAVLIPRPETELLVEQALKLMKDDVTAAPPFICDVGTGSGCIAVSLLYESTRARGVALDISPEALVVARRNARRANVADRLAFVASDVFTGLDSYEPRFSMIVSNPPYIRADELASLAPEVRDYEPRAALTPREDKHLDGTGVIRRLLRDAPRLLRPGGTLLFEIGFGQQALIETLIDPCVWTTLDVLKDLQGISRTFVLRRA